jgi:uncharacterized protein YjbI with pentapeptide repeats
MHTDHILQTPEWVLEQYKAGQRDFTGIELPEFSSLRGVDLSGANFFDSWLSAVDLSEAILERVRFEDCNLKTSLFRKTSLRGASFQGSALCGADFKGADVRETKTEGATWYGAEVDTLAGLV